LNIEYGTSDGTPRQFTWTGSIAPLESATVSTPSIPELRTNTNTTGLTGFTVKILKVNGNTDEDNSNNTLQSYFKASVKWPMTIIVVLRTNNVPETSWKILDELNNIVAQRAGTASNTTYTDTVNYGPGSYRLIVTDDGCDGLSFWANSGAGSGSVTVRNTSSSFGMPLTGYFGGDFGCGFTHWFNAYWPLGIENANSSVSATMEVYPNPAREDISLSFAGIKNVNGTVKLVDALGRIVISEKCNTPYMQISTKEMANGVYSIVYRAVDGDVILQSKVIIAK
jgi:hypothetical protein